MPYRRQAVEPAYRPLSPCTRMYIGPQGQLGLALPAGVHASKCPPKTRFTAPNCSRRRPETDAFPCHIAGRPWNRHSGLYRRVHACTLGRRASWGSPLRRVYMRVNAPQKLALPLRIAAIGAPKPAHFHAVSPAGRGTWIPASIAVYTHVHRAAGPAGARPYGRCTCE
jgi:hypothetical protein